MRVQTAVTTAFLVLGLTSDAGAQQLPDAANRTVDVERLRVDLERIHRGLRQSATREERDGLLHLKYFVDVYGEAPRIELFTRQDNLLNGPVPYGAPTHSQILEVITPQEFRSPVMDFGAVIRWLSDRAKDKR